MHLRIISGIFMALEKISNPSDAARPDGTDPPYEQAAFGESARLKRQ